MANRRMGGGRSYNYSHHVNPWQEGAAPGSNQNFNSSGLSQLVDPTQIALAITNLLRPQQTQSVPSLLSLPPIAPVRNSGRQYGYNNGNNINSYRSNYSMANKMNVRNSRDMDFNKRQNISNRKPQQRKPNTSVNRTSAKNTVAKPKVSTNSETSKTKKDSETSSKLTAVQSDADTNDDCKPSEDQSEEQEESKRDWKEEKNNSDFNESNEDGNTEEFGKKTGEEGIKEETETSEKNGVEDDSKSNQAKDNTDDRYAGIPTSMLRCFICQKRMWDVESFEKHIRGKAHQEMLDSYEESCKIKADMMRESMRLAEEKKWIEMNRLKRLGKHVSMNMESHCNMCDLNFIGKLNAHRKSQGHQKLKYFIHPRCTECQKEFQTRIEFEHHRLSPSHMRVRLENWNKKKEGNEDAIPIENEELDLGPDMPEDEDEECEEALNKNIIFDITEDMNLADLEHRLPHYSKKLQFGASFIESVTGHQCKLCNLFLISENSMKAHLSSAKHYNAFVDFLIKEKNKGKTEKRPISSEQTDDNEGNWKRRKIASEETDVPADDIVEESAVQDVGNEIYDPTKAENDHSESENETTEVQNTSEDNSNKTVKSEENYPNIQIKEEVTENTSEVTTDEVKKEITSTSPRTRARSLRNPAPRGKARGGKAQ